MFYAKFLFYIKSLQGLIIKRIQDSISCEENRRFIYLGDGSGDYCPSLSLRLCLRVWRRREGKAWKKRNEQVKEIEENGR